MYYFGSFCLNQTEKQLLRHGEPVRLAPKAFDLLLVLIQNQGNLVTKERLLAEVWPHVFVEEANLSVNVASLRKVLDEGDKRRYIQTVPKRGYRFVADRAGLTLEPFDGERKVLNSLAVLPFENEGGGQVGEYLAAGLMESVTNDLSQSPDLRVMARHTVYSHHRDVVEPLAVGEKLGVDSILLGRILALEDRLIVRAELVDVRNGWQLWGEQFHTRISDVLTVQQELTSQIAEGLRLRFKKSVYCVTHASASLM